MADSRDCDAFLKLVEQHGAVLLAMLRHLCGNGPDADDVFQETAVRVWRSISRRPLLRNPRAWLLTIGYRTFLDLRDSRPHQQAYAEVADTRLESPGDRAVRLEEAERSAVAIEQLSEPLRQVVILHYTGALSLRQTGEVLGISEGTVKSRLNAALAKLRSVLE
jgi:RNA polymerase sigma-70 factor (ECF subfamily)